jgi:hypothetical protein
LRRSATACRLIPSSRAGSAANHATNKDLPPLRGLDQSRGFGLHDPRREYDQGR